MSNNKLSKLLLVFTIVVAAIAIPTIVSDLMRDPKIPIGTEVNILKTQGRIMNYHGGTDMYTINYLDNKGIIRTVKLKYDAVKSLVKFQ